MTRLINRYASSLLTMAAENNRLPSVYQQALALLGENTYPVSPTSIGVADDDTAVNASDGTGSAQAPSEDNGAELSAFIQFVLQKEVQPVLRRFVEMAREYMGIVAVEVVSAVPLTQEQKENLEIRLIRYFKKQVELTLRVDPSLLGGLRIIAGDTVIDTTIKTQLSEMRRSVYKGVYTAG